MNFGGPVCRLQICSSLAREWFDSTFWAFHSFLLVLFASYTKWQGISVSGSFSLIRFICKMKKFWVLYIPTNWRVLYECNRQSLRVFNLEFSFPFPVSWLKYLARATIFLLNRKVSLKSKNKRKRKKSKDSITRPYLDGFQSVVFFWLSLIWWFV